jgi:hypothetical protein
MPCPYYQFSPVNIFDVYKNGGNLNDIYDQPFFESIRRWQDDYAYRRIGDETGNWLRPCPIRDHHKIAMEAIEKYRVKPEDEETEKWLYDEKLHQGLMTFDKQLAELMDPYWQKIYLREETIDYNPQLPFTSSGIPRLEIRFS